MQPADDTATAGAASKPAMRSLPRDRPARKQTPFIAWLDRGAATIIAGAALMPGIFAVEVFGLAVRVARHHGCETFCLLVAFGAWLPFMAMVAGLAVALGVWHRHILGRLVGLAVSATLAAMAIERALRLSSESAATLHEEIQASSTIAMALGSASLLILTSLVVSGLALAGRLRER